MSKQKKKVKRKLPYISGLSRESKTAEGEYGILTVPPAVTNPTGFLESEVRHTQVKIKLKPSSIRKCLLETSKG